MLLNSILKSRSNYFIRFSTNFHCRFISERVRQRRIKMELEIKSRENPIVLKIDTLEFKKLFTKELNSLRSIFDKHGYEIRIAGGAVRDLLMGIQPKDLDFATTATPEQMKDLFTKENVRLINASGEKHGTITPRINDAENFEVTTLRIDVVTDGRRAEVEYTTDWKLDASRRDLTINSMFLGFDGSVYDYFYGYDDLMAKRIVYVGNPDIRIKEDYLRILRYFRFYGRIAEKADNHEDIILHAISQNVSGLQIISGERIWMEVKQILSGNFAGQLMKTMLHVGIGKYIGLPDEPNMAEFDRVCEIGCKHEFNPISLVAALLHSLDDAIAVHLRLKLSAFERDLMFFIIQHREPKISQNPILPYQKLIINTKLTQKVTVEYVKELLKYKNNLDLLDKISYWDIPKFPINGAMLKENKVPQGKSFGLVLVKLKEYWAERDFKTAPEELLNLIPVILENLKSNKK